MSLQSWPELLEQQQAYIGPGVQNSHVGTLLQAINRYVDSLHGELDRLRNTAGPENGGPPNKKRRIDVSSAHSANPSKAALANKAPDLTVLDVSFSTPVRKKLRVELVGGISGGIRAIDGKTQSTEAMMSWDEIDQILSVPVPEKAQPAHNFLFIPHDNSKDTLVLTLPGTPATGFQVSQTPSVRAPSLEESATQPEAFARWISSCSAGRCHVVEPSADEFLSQLSQPHKSSIKPAHVKAFRGSKDGFLYLLAPGIVFGFRKPVLWFPFDCIVSVSYTSVLQRTFNMVISARGVEAGKDAEEEIEYEFAMLDQADFAGIDAYVKRHGLQDASLAEARRAKRYGINDARRGKGEANGGPNEQANDGEEIASAVKTEQQLQDEEDELEEDFDPGSGGESDGSGTDSDDDDDTGAAEAYDHDDLGHNG